MAKDAGLAGTRPRLGSGPPEHPDRPALHTPAGTLTHAELDDLVRLAAEGLDRLAAGRRQLVHLRPSRTVEFVVAWLAALRGGHPALLTADAQLAAAYRVSAIREEGDWTVTGTSPPDLHPDLRLLLSTSGSTGSPKLVRLSAGNLDANAAAIAAGLGLDEHAIALTTLPFGYCYGLSVLHSHLLAGAAVLLDDRSVADPGLWANARRHAVTSFAGVPHTFDLLGAAGWPDLPSLRQVTQAGGRMAPDRVRALAAQGRRDGWELVVMYGQTEATARMAYLPSHLAEEHPHTVGHAVDGGSFRLAPVDGAAPGVGELSYRGPNVMMGYATGPDDLARAAELDELATGDLARIDADGLVEIVGRRSRFAKLFGQRIDLDRVQSLLALAGHDVVCAESTDGRRLVVAAPGDPDPVALAEIAGTVAVETGLPPHAVGVIGIGELPRSSHGKIDLAAVARLAPGDAAVGDSIEARISGIYGRVLGRPVRPEENFVDLGGDSLSYVELALRLEEVLGRLPGDWPRLSVAELAGRVETRRERGAPGQVVPEGADGPRPTPRSRLARVETGIVLRALAIVAIVGSHTNLWVVLGGAHVLLAVAGANVARFQLTDEDARCRLARTLRTIARIVVPAVAWLAVATALTGAYPWRTVFLLNGVLGDPTWSEPAWHHWFIEVLVLLSLATGVLTALPRVLRLERRYRFGFAAGLAAVALLPRLWATASSYDGDVIHSAEFLAWLFLLGWASAVARTTRHRLIVTGLLLAGVVGFTGDPVRDTVIAGGVLVLVWSPTVPWPRVLLGVTGTLASASLYIYLTHWQVYPHFEQWWPLGGLLASLTTGVLLWQLVERVSGRRRRLIQGPDRLRVPTESRRSPRSQERR